MSIGEGLAWILQGQWLTQVEGVSVRLFERYFQGCYPRVWSDNQIGHFQHLQLKIGDYRYMYTLQVSGRFSTQVDEPYGESVPALSCVGRCGHQ